METAIYILRWLCAVPIGAVFALCAIGNWGILLTAAFSYFFSRESEYSSSFILPYLGPILGVAFFLLVPISNTAWYWWTSFIIDPIFLIAGIGLALSPLANRPE